jgi:hypothetical protein
MNATEARLYISWKHDELKYYTRKVDSFLLQKPNDYVEFRKYVRNIIDWGKDRRLKEIRDSLNILLEESRKTASQLAKSRPSPSDDSASSSSHKRKDSSSRGRNSRAKSVQEYPSGGANAPPSASFQEYNQDEAFAQIPAADSVYASPYAIFPANNENDPFIQASTANNGYSSPDGLTFPLTTPPQSSEDTSLPLESSEDIDESNVRGHRRTRRTRTPVVIVDARETRRKH